MQSKQVIATPDAPPALGPYSQAIRVNDTIYVSGQLPMDPKTRQLISGNIATQTERVLLNIRAIFEEGEASLEHVVKITIYMKDLSQFDDMNRVFGLFFPTSENSRISAACALNCRGFASAARCVHRNGRHRRCNWRLRGFGDFLSNSRTKAKTF